MDKSTITRLAALTDEERELLEGRQIDTAVYFSENEAVVNSEGLFGGSCEIGIRMHTRFAEFPRHKHGYLEAMIVLSGEITHAVGDEMITLSAGDILFLNKHIEHGVMKTEIGDVGVNISLSDAFLSGAASQIVGEAFLTLLAENAKACGEGRYLYFSTAGDTAAENLVENIILELLGGAGDSVAAKYLEILMQYLSRESQRLLTDGNCSTADKHARRMREVSEYIKMSPAAASLSEISARLYLCPPYLSKLIKEYFGKSFKELVVDERMNRAHRLIAKTDMNIGDAIRSVGYDNESYFHKEFKKRYGESPLSVRKKLRENAKMKT